MKPQEYAAVLRHLAEEALAAAEFHTSAAAEARRKAEQQLNAALNCDQDAARKTVEAQGWDAIAAALESGAITLQDGQLLTEVRSTYADAHDALATTTRSLPVFGADVQPRSAAAAEVLSATPLARAFGDAPEGGAL